jgi:hypothetical protein
LKKPVLPAQSSWASVPIAELPHWGLTIPSTIVFGGIEPPDELPVIVLVVVDTDVEVAVVVDVETPVEVTVETPVDVTVETPVEVVVDTTVVVGPSAFVLT